MAAGAHDGGGGFGQTAGARTARGIAVIAVAVLVGLVLMFQGLGDDETAAEGNQTEAGVSDDDTTLPAEGEETGESVSTEGDTADPGTTDTTVADLVPATARPPIEVTVLVANGTNGIKGAAGRGTQVVADAGFSTATAADADVAGPSLVLYTEGYEADANAVAEAFGVDPALVVQPFDPANSPVSDTQGANIIVRIGNDTVIQV